MYIIIGLGNPESKYDNTYHNIGFMFIDKLSRELDIKINKKACNSLLGEGFYNGKKIMLVKPQTYMNLSGKSVLSLKSKYKEANLIVVCDDIDLPAGKLRFRERGSGGTHNGMRDIVNCIGQEFNRLRIGIGRDESRDLADFVLSKIKDRELFDKALDEAVKLLLGKIDA